MNILKMMQEARRVQERLREELQELRVEASSGGGAVTVTLDGNKRAVAVKISPDAVRDGDLEMLEDLVLTAVNEAGRRVDATVAGKLAGLTGGLPIPGLTGS